MPPKKNEKLSLDELNRISVEDFKAAEKFPFSFILDDIRSRNNVGTFFRTADAFRANQVLLCGITPTPPHRDIEKTAIGATASVDFAYYASILELTEKLRAEGWKIAAVEQTTNAIPLDDFRVNPNDKVAFIFGNEVFGVNQAVIDAADIVLEIPQYGTKHSLNVAVSAGIVAWDFMTKHKKSSVA